MHKLLYSQTRHHVDWSDPINADFYTCIKYPIYYKSCIERAVAS